MSYITKSGNIENNINLEIKYTWEIKINNKNKYFNGNKTYNGAVEEELKEHFGEKNIRYIDSDEKEKIKLQEKIYGD